MYHIILEFKNGKKVFIYLIIQKRAFVSVFKECNLFFS